MDRFDKATGAKAEAATTAPESAPTANGNGHVKDEAMEELASATSPPPSNKRKAPDPEEDEDEEMSELEDSSPAPKKAKKSKAPKDDEDNDAKLAAKLQAELNAGQRSTRGGGAKRRAPIKKEKKAKKKSKAKIGSDDDSAVEGEEKPEKEKKGGFHVCLAAVPITFMTLTIPTETHEPLRTSLRDARRNTTLATTDGQKDMGIRQGARLTEPQGQTTNHVRRCDARSLQGRFGAHVHDEQAPGQPPVPSGRGGMISGRR